MNENKPENITEKVAELEKKLDASIDAIGKLVKALDYMRGDDPRFIFEMDLVKHSLCEAGYGDITSVPPESSGSPSS